jgi:hypothetical protein
MLGNDRALFSEEGIHKETTGLTKVGGVVLPSTSGKVSSLHRGAYL